MDSVLFEEWIREIDTKFTKEKKKVALIIDNCPAHLTINNLKSIELILLPRNTTSKLQPMDQEVIRSLKAYYKALALERLVVAIDKGKVLPVFPILDAIKMLDLASCMLDLALSLIVLRKQKIRKINRKLPSRMTTTPSEIFKIRSKNLVNFTLQVQQLKMSFLQTKAWYVQYLY